MDGKSIRLSRLINTVTNKTCIIPIDHGATLGPIDGIADYAGIIRQVLDGGADAVILHKGLLRSIADYPELTKGNYLLHLSVSTMLSTDPTCKVLASTVEEAVRLGAEGVSVHVNLGVTTEPQMIKDLGTVARTCMEWGMPLLAMMYSHKLPRDFHHIIHAARLAQELGADIVKVTYPGSFENTRELVSSVQIPVVIAGGAKVDNTKELLYIVDDAVRAGAAGVAIGRNIFLHKDPEFMTGIISMLVHGRLSIQECLNKIEEWEYINGERRRA